MVTAANFTLWLYFTRVKRTKLHTRPRHAVCLHLELRVAIRRTKGTETMQRMTGETAKGKGMLHLPLAALKRSQPPLHAARPPERCSSVEQL